MFIIACGGVSTRIYLLLLYYIVFCTYTLIVMLRKAKNNRRQYKARINIIIYYIVLWYCGHIIIVRYVTYFVVMCFYCSFFSKNDKFHTHQAMYHIHMYIIMPCQNFYILKIAICPVI